MASVDNLSIKVRLSPDEETMQLILLMLNMWQDSHPHQMVAMVPAYDRYQYEIIQRGKEAKHGDTGDQRGDSEQRTGD